MFTKLLKPKEVAQILGVSKSFVYQLIKRRQIVSIRIGQSTRVRPEDLDAFIQQRMQKPIAD